MMDNGKRSRINPLKSSNYKYDTSGQRLSGLKAKNKNFRNYLVTCCLSSYLLFLRLVLMFIIFFLCFPARNHVCFIGLILCIRSSVSRILSGFYLEMFFLVLCLFWFLFSTPFLVLELLRHC